MEIAPYNLIPIEQSIDWAAAEDDEPLRKLLEEVAAMLDRDAAAIQPWQALTDLTEEIVASFPEQPAPGQLFFPSPEATEAHEALREFCFARRAVTRLSVETGLSACLFGPLQEPMDDFVIASEKFLTEHELFIAGRHDGIQLELTRIVKWVDGTAQTQYRQTSAENIPIYSSHLICTFDATQQLVLVTSSLYPVKAAELPRWPDPEPQLDEIALLLTDQLPEKIGFSGWLESTRSWLRQRWFFPRRAHANSDINQDVYRHAELWNLDEDGEWQLRPTADETFADRQPSPENSQYHPMRMAPFVDQKGHPWFAMIDVADGVLLKVEPAEAHDFKPYRVFPTTQAALAATANSISLNLGTDATTLRQAVPVRFSGLRLYDPGDLTEGPLGAADQGREFLAATVFYHIWKMQVAFSALLKLANEQVLPADLANPVNQIKVSLDAQAGDARYNSADRTIFVRSGTTGTNPVKEPGFDGEAIAHELTHAVMSHYYRPCFETNNNEARYLLSRGLDEALAFYHACCRFGEPHWAEFAYGSWGNLRHLDQPLVGLAALNVTTDPASLGHGYGIWWAQALWLLFQSPALQVNFQLRLLKALRAQASTLPYSPVATADPFTQLRSGWGHLADVLMMQAGSTDELDAMSAVFSQLDIPLTLA